jgi:hypothetical protein
VDDRTEPDALEPAGAPARADRVCRTPRRRSPPERGDGRYPRSAACEHELDSDVGDGGDAMELKTDRLGLLLDQLDASLDIARQRLAGLTDAEYFWEPVPGCWSLRRRAGAPPGGAGDWALDWARPEPVPAPVTTIAWRVGHLQTGFSLRWDWTFGARRATPESVALSPSAAEALERLWDVLARWRDGVAGLSDAQLDTVGLSQSPYGLDRQVPFIALTWWTNRELVQHTSEVALLRDLWANRTSGTPS